MRALTTETGAKQFAGSAITSSDRAFLYPIIGGRNIALGLSLVALSLQGQRKAVGTVFACSAVIGMVDSWFCYKHGSEKWLGHAIGSSIGLPLTWLFLTQAKK
jgi:hypothetical protein